MENLRGMSEFDPTRRTTQYGNMDRPNYVAEEYYSDEDHYRNFVNFDNTKNAWVRNATALHFVYSMVGTQRGSQVDYGAGLRVARTGLTEGGCAEVHIRSAWPARARAAVPFRRGPSLVHDGPAHRRTEMCFWTARQQPRFHQASRTSSGRRATCTTTFRRHSPRGSGRTSTSDGRAQTQCSGTARAASSFRNRRRRRTFPSDTGGERRCVQHPATGPDERKRSYRIARQARHAAESVSHAVAREAGRRGGSSDSHGRPDRVKPQWSRAQGEVHA